MKTLITIILSFLSLVCIAQTYSIQGSITDENDEQLQSATVVILSQIDSTMAGFALSANDGRFIVRDLEEGEYLLQVSFLGYEQYSAKVSAANSEYEVDVKTIQLLPAANQIQEIVVKGETTPIEVKKDTIVYNANAFKTQPNDVVEDLLRQMPGVEVEDDGTIVAQGEEVEKVTVDGKDFFGNDPSIATKNLPAKAIDKVEFFDQKSDRTEFTGVDDGERTKTMNLELKEDYKKGFFGNTEVAGGYDNSTEEARYSKTEINLSYFVNDILSDISSRALRETFINDSRSFFSDDQVQNTGNTSYNSNANQFTPSGSLLYRKRLGNDAPWVVTLEGNLNKTNNDANGDLNSDNDFAPSDPTMDLRQILLQEQLERDDENTYRIDATITQPIGNRQYLDYSFRHSNTSNDVSTDVFDIDDDIQTLNNLLSTQYTRDFSYNRYGVAWQKEGDNSSLSLGTYLQQSQLNGDIENLASPIDNSNIAILPTARYRYEIDRGHNFSLRYRTSINQPTLEQLQPVLDVTDPINLYVGNPDLEVEYRHNLRMNYIKWDQFNFSSLFAFMTVLTYNTNMYSENSDQNLSFVNQSYQMGARLDAIKSWSFATDMDVRHYSAQNFSPEETIPIWTASISKYFMEGDKGELRISAYDLLNQNQSINRVSNANYVENETINTLGRYIMASFLYSFTSTGGEAGGAKPKRMFMMRG